MGLRDRKAIVDPPVTDGQIEVETSPGTFLLPAAQPGQVQPAIPAAPTRPSCLKAKVNGATIQQVVNRGHGLARTKCGFTDRSQYDITFSVFESYGDFADSDGDGVEDGKGIKIRSNVEIFGFCSYEPAVIPEKEKDSK